MEKSSIGRQEDICFTTSGFAGFPGSAVEILFASQPDAKWGDMNKGKWYYKVSERDGRHCLQGGNPPGEYELRGYLEFLPGKTFVEARARLTIEDKDVVNTVPSSSTSVQNPTVWLDKPTFNPNEQILVHFQAPASWSRDAWIGIVPSNIPHGDEAVNDKYDVAYQFIEKRTSGTLSFIAPGPGQWDFRMHDTDQNGREFFNVPFIVR